MGGCNLKIQEEDSRVGRVIVIYKPQTYLNSIYPLGSAHISRFSNDGT